MNNRPLMLLACLLLLVCGTLFHSFGVSREQTNSTDLPKSPVPPAEEQKFFRLAPGLKMELVASEPKIESPVAMAFDEHGQLWVVEMRDYPNGPAKGEKPHGRIRVLQDRNDDGYYEKSTIFADNLLFANGILPWNGGVIVTAAPHVLYLKDTTGDGQADHREILYEGFMAENPQLRVSHPVLGIDNWVYLANGLRGGTVRRFGEKRPPMDLRGRDFRFQPNTLAYETITGMGQFGNTFDRWGRRFVCDNRHHVRHVVLEDHYLKRNPFLGVSQVLNDISVLEGGQLNSGGKVYPLSKNWTTSNLHAGRFTAACSVLFYCGSLLPEPFQDCVYTCDPTGNLVHREIVTPSGGSFTAKPARQGVEFFATPEDWCRPVFLTHGPDDALYMVDMYRAVIEHPQFMPPELKNRPDLTLGKDRGRIWRIVPENYKHQSFPKLANATNAELVKALSAPQACTRSTAQRLLLEKQDRTAIPLLQQTFVGKSPLAKIHAAWLLNSMNALDVAMVQKLLADSHPRVREHAIKLAESRLGAETKTALKMALLKLADDPDSHVRFQTALALGEMPGSEIIPALARIAMENLEDTWTRTAVLSSVGDQPVALLEKLHEIGLTRRKNSDRIQLWQELLQLIGSRNNMAENLAVFRLLRNLKGQESTYWQWTALDALGTGLARRSQRLQQVLSKLADSKETRTLATDLQEILRKTTKVAVDSQHSNDERSLAIRLLAHVSWDQAKPALQQLLQSENPQALHVAVIRTLAEQQSDEVATLLLDRWPVFSPALRREAAEALVRQPQRTKTLLAAIRDGKVRSVDLDAIRTRQLLNHRDKEIRANAQKLLQKELPEDRLRVLAKYQDALKIKGRANLGRIVFQLNCATCHRIGDLGVDVGPTISDTRTQTKSALLTAILNPNAAIDNNYVSYTITTTSGRVLTGIISNETATSVTLKQAENKEDTVLRRDIEEIISTGVSLMPDGLEKNISPRQMADLLEYLKNWRYLDGAVPLENNQN